MQGGYGGVVAGLVWGGWGRCVSGGVLLAEGGAVLLRCEGFAALVVEAGG